MRELAGTDGAVVAEAVVLRDHDPYGPATVRRIVDAVHRHKPDAVVTTEKDWTKLGAARVEWGCPVYRPVLERSFDRGWDELWGHVRRGVGIGSTTPILSVSKSEGKVGQGAR